MRDRTLLEQNEAGDQGKSVYLAEGSSFEYQLPTPPARWLFISQGDTFRLEPGAVDSEFPFACPSGVVGGTTVQEQSGPSCRGPW